MVMRGNRAWVLGGLAAMAAGAGVIYFLKDKRPRIDEDSRVLLIGDSLALGLEYPLRSLAGDAEVPFRTEAIGGSNLRHWNNRNAMLAYATSIGEAPPALLEQTLLEFHPTLILVSLGTNDEFLGEAGVAAEADDLDQLLEFLESYAEVAWIGVPHLGGTAGAVAMIRETGVPYYPTEKLEIPRAGDNLHPTVAGYAGWAGSLWDWLT